MEKFISNSEEATKKIAKEFSQNLKQNSLILLKGNLGVGKTIFVKGFAEGLGINEKVTSPTFGIKSEYGGLVHYDLYLADKKIDVLPMIVEDIQDNHVIIEWSEKLPKKILSCGKIVEINMAEGEDREIIFI